MEKPEPMPEKFVSQYEVIDIILGSTTSREELSEVDVSFTDPFGQITTVPAFASGGNWHVRYSSEVLGRHRYKVNGADLQCGIDTDGIVSIQQTQSSDGIFGHGPLRVRSNQRYFEHCDGTPFLWLADTWWHGLTDRIRTVDFCTLAEQRAEQGYSVIQIVAGLYPEISPSQEGASLADFAWLDNFAKLNVEWFEEADKRILQIMNNGLVPCIFGSWGYYLRSMKISQIRQHWRELIARWGAYPVVWCVAGEPSSIWYDDRRPILTGLLRSNASREKVVSEYNEQISAAVAEQLEKHSSVAELVRELEPFGRPITTHSFPGDLPWEYFDNEDVVDFWLLQTGHGGENVIDMSINAIVDAINHAPIKPVINGEVCYEGIAGANWQDVQRFLFWTHILSGSAGHTYGAWGLCLASTPESPGFYSGRAPFWHEAARFSGSAQLGLGRKLLLNLPWNDFLPHPEWVEDVAEGNGTYPAFAAGVADEIRLIYFPSTARARSSFGLVIKLCGLGEHPWLAQLINPSTCEVEESFTLEPGSDGTAVLSSGYANTPLPSWDDWLLLLRPQ